MADITAPILKRLNLPATIDLGQGEQNFLASVEAADEDGGSGVKQVTVMLNKELAWADYRSTFLMFGESWMSDTFADSTPGVASHRFSLQEKTPAGSYAIEEVWVTDVAGNRRIYDAQQLHGMGIATAITITGKPVDTTAPTLTSLSLPSTVDLSRGDATFTAIAEARDNEGGTGVRNIMIWFDKELTIDGLRMNLTGIGYDRDNFDDSTPTYAAEPSVLGRATAPGTYRILNVDVKDHAGNQTRYTLHDLEAMGIATTMTVTGGSVDTKPPELLDLSLPRIVALGSGEQQVVTVQARDEGAGMQAVYLELDRPLAVEGRDATLIAVGAYDGQDNFEDATPGYGTARLALTDATAPGIYNVTEARLYDAAGNRTVYTAAQLQARGIQTSLTVVAGEAPAKVRAEVESGALLLSLASRDWALAASDETSLTIKYDTTQARFMGAYIEGAPALVSSSVTQSGDVAAVTLTTYGAIPADALLRVVLKPQVPGSAMHYAVDSFTVNGHAQAISTGRAGALAIGTSGADSFTASLAVSTIDGQEGLDRVVIDGWKDAYAIRKEGTGLVVEHSSGLHLDLSNIERIVFNDRTLAFDIHGAAGQMYRLYQAAFDRKPDEYELGFWMGKLDAGTWLHRIADAFVLSHEFDMLYGPNASAETFVEALYDNVLHRTPDGGGVAFWVNALKSGADRAGVLIQFSESAENVAQVIGSIQGGITYYS
jgi:hypothetical protein